MPLTVTDEGAQTVVTTPPFPLEQWRKVDDSLERLHGEIKRRCYVVGVLPTRSSA